jgi:CBS domain containing-hemolysin-like protein
VPIGSVLHDMQRTRVQMAIVADEHGDVAGLLTLEDIVEEIVGDIADEDGMEVPPIADLGDGRWRVDAKTRVRAFNELTGAELPESDDWHTIAGLLTGTLARIPGVGEELRVDGYKLHVEQSDGRRIGAVIVERTGTSGGRAADG